MANYTNKKTNVKKFMFAALDYIPGKLVYITNIDKNTIYFLIIYIISNAYEKKVMHSI